jgi:hypothetical protein
LTRAARVTRCGCARFLGTHLLSFRYFIFESNELSKHTTATPHPGVTPVRVPRLLRWSARHGDRHGALAVA